VALELWAPGRGLRLLDYDQRVRSFISEDGEVTDAKGSVLAYINPDGEVGSHEMDYLGAAQEASGQVTGREDQVVGEYDQGRGYVKNSQGSVIAEVSKEGFVTGNGGQTAGKVDGFAYDLMTQIAAYILLVDPDFVSGC